MHRKGWVFQIATFRSPKMRFIPLFFWTINQWCPVPWNIFGCSLGSYGGVDRGLKSHMKEAWDRTHDPWVTRRAVTTAPPRHPFPIFQTRKNSELSIILTSLIFHCELARINFCPPQSSIGKWVVLRRELSGNAVDEKSVEVGIGVG